MKAAVLYQTGKPLVIETGIRIPKLKPGQVLVKIAYSGLCRSQLMETRGFRGKDKYLPHLLGHEGSGRVVKVGRNVKKVAVDDYVILGWIKGEGCDESNARYHKNSTIINAGAVTTFCEYAVISENRCIKLPEGVPLDVAVLFGCALPTGAGIVFNEICPKPNRDAAIFGLGGIGMSALMALSTFETKRLIVVDISDQKLEIAKDIGASHCINASDGNAVEKIFRMTSGQGVDYSIEAAGIVETIEQAFECVKKNGGLCVFATHPKSGDKIRLDPHQLISGKLIRGTWGGNCIPERDIPIFAQLYFNGKLPLEKLIKQRFSLDQINEALSALENNEIERAIIEINSFL
jgi:S-(hydroxymethyl)glutathione dehydrogenase/alcohol dehydrogenase